MANEVLIGALREARQGAVEERTQWMDRMTLTQAALDDEKIDLERTRGRYQSALTNDESVKAKMAELNKVEDRTGVLKDQLSSLGLEQRDAFIECRKWEKAVREKQMRVTELEREHEVACRQFDAASKKIADIDAKIRDAER